MTQKLPEYLLGKYQLIGTVTFSTLFALVFLNIYIPFSETAWFGLGNSETFTYTLIFIAAGIGSLITSRILMYYAKTIFDFTYLIYSIWCICEIGTIAGLYTIITKEIPSFTYETGYVFTKSLIYGTIALGIPYLISGMYLAIIEKNNTIRLMNYENVVTDEPKRDYESQKRITLHDNQGVIKLSINLDNLYYIESDDNYIKVWYTDTKEQLKQYMLRCRLKTVEDNFKDSGLVRCNRKYIVNINKVNLLHKENDGYILDLCNEDIPSIPVTKTYVDLVLGYFTEQQPLMDPLD